MKQVSSPDLSVIIPNRNSPFTTNTINDVLNKAGCSVEVIVHVDEDWPLPLVNDDRVVYIHPNNPIGLRKAINRSVDMARGKFIMKTDDHCLFGDNFGRILINSHKQDNWVQIPRRFALDAENWKVEERGDNKYPIDYMYIDFPRVGKDHDNGMHGVPWQERRDSRNVSHYSIDETPSMQGSCYFMSKNHFKTFLGGLQELPVPGEVGYGQFAQEAQEIGFKTWLGGGAVMVNKETSYAHLHKGGRYGRMYKFPGGTIESSNWSASYWLNNRWVGRKHDFEWFINEKFPDMPSWPKDWKEELQNMGWYEKYIIKKF